MVEHLFREESSRIVAILTRIFGSEHLGLAEDVVQETLARALRLWPFHGVPDNPPAWIMRTARNLALDQLRRQQLFQARQGEILQRMEQWLPGENPAPAVDGGIGDDRLRLMFVCCHPRVPADAQAALALKVLCGFGVGEISAAFLSTEAAVLKRLTRAKQKIREAAIPFEIPSGPELEGRLDGVLKTLYLLFNEGYKASTGPDLVRAEVCREAIRLTSQLALHPVGDRPKVHALLALMLLNAARLTARVDAQGRLLRLAEQDRSQWDRELLARGMYHLVRSANGAELSEYHLQSGIAACHAVAPSEAETDWPRVLQLYDQLLAFDRSPIVALNRAIALAKVKGPAAGLDAVQRIHDAASLKTYYLYHAVLGEFQSQLSQPALAAVHFRRAMELAALRSEQEFLSRRCRDCETAS